MRFGGAVDFADGIWIGIDTDKPIGKTDGSVKGKPYFRCNSDYGVFLQAPSVDPDAVKQSTLLQTKLRKRGAHGEDRDHPRRRR